MEKISALSQIENLTENSICIDRTGEHIEFSNSEIIFKGTNNLLYLEPNVKLKNSSFCFNGSNSIIYLSGSKNTYYLHCAISHNSTIFIGADTYMNPFNSGRVNLFATEEQNIIIGKDCLFSFDIFFRTADPHTVYDCNTKKRINPSKSILLGDHIWLGQNCLILKGTHIGSGAIIGGNSVLANTKVASNTSVAGNPARVIRQNVFFTKACVHNYTAAETAASMTFHSDSYIYEKNESTMDLLKIDAALKQDHSIENRLEIIRSMLIAPSDKDRFFL